MKLKNRIAIVIILIMVVATLVCWGVFRAVILKSFDRFESDQAVRSVMRCVSDINNEIDHLDELLLDWSARDELYAFTRTHNREFAESNLATPSFSNLDINLLCIHDEKGRLLWKKVFDKALKKDIPFDLTSDIDSGSFKLLTKQDDPSRSIKGIILTRHGPMILASRPILTSDGKGPSRGSIIMGRFTSLGVFSKVSRNSGIDFRTWPVSEGRRPERFPSKEILSSRGDPVSISRLPDTLKARTLIRDISGKPAVILEASIPRTIMEQGLQAYHAGVILVLCTGFILLAVVSGMVKFMIFRPISTLTKNMLSVRGLKHGAPSFESSRNDEIGTLSQECAAMMKRVSESEELFRFLAENARDVIWMADLDLNFIYMSPAVEKVRGVRVEEALKEGIKDIMTPESYARVMKIYNKDRLIKLGRATCANLEATIDLEIFRKDGSTVWTEITVNALYDDQGRVNGIMGIARDISERKKAEEERKKLEKRLLQNQKMEALGRFAGGIAHDMNNILYPIIINGETLLQGCEPGTERYQITSQIISSAYRQRNLVRQILSFSRKDNQKLTPIKVIPVIQETLGFLRSSLPSTIRIRQQFITSEDTIVGDPTQIQQVIMNLCRNAADAMESQSGTIEVVLENAYIDPAKANQEMRPGRYILLKIHDTGAGIPPDIVGRIFEPFFTTKGADKGTGMGLAVVHGVVSNLGGIVTVESEPGKGTLFSIYLPAYGEEKAVKPRQKQGDLPLPEEMAAGRTGRILLVDDEEFILSSLKRVLQRSGYDITAMTNGAEALTLFSKDPQAFDLVITDQTMPQMTGSQLTVKILEIRPDIPVIISTGFSEIIGEKEAKAMGVREILMKPASTGELFAAISRALTGSQGSPAKAAETAKSESLS